MASDVFSLHVSSRLEVFFPVGEGYKARSGIVSVSLFCFFVAIQDDQGDFFFRTRNLYSSSFVCP